MDYLDRADDSHGGDEFESSALIAEGMMDAKKIIEQVGNDALKQGRSKAFIRGAKIGAAVEVIGPQAEPNPYAIGSAYYDAWESGWKWGFRAAVKLNSRDAA
jgi:hypothetical protein